MNPSSVVCTTAFRIAFVGALLLLPAASADALMFQSIKLDDGRTILFVRDCSARFKDKDCTESAKHSRQIGGRSPMRHHTSAGSAWTPSETDPARLETPYFLCDEQELARNLAVIDDLRAGVDCRVLFASKSLALDSVLRRVLEHVDGMVVSGVCEARHAATLTAHRPVHIMSYSPAFSDSNFGDFVSQSTEIVFNSMSQVARHRDRADPCDVGIRVNPGVSAMRTSRHYGGLSDYSRRYSRLGVLPETIGPGDIAAARIHGLMWHVNCENPDFNLFVSTLRECERRCQHLLSSSSVKWVSLGGGVSYTRPGYPIADFMATIRSFRNRYDVDVFLEPGHAIVSTPFRLVASVVDVVKNEKDILVLDTSADAHLPDALLYPTQWTIEGALAQSETEPRVYVEQPGHEYVVAGATCLAGDVFGCYKFPEFVHVGDRVEFRNAGDYSIVKNTFFNGIPKPSVYLRRVSGELEPVRRYTYEDYLSSVS